MSSGKYKFRCLSPFEYELVFNMSVEGRVFDLIFSKAKAKLARTKNLSVKGKPDDLKEIPIPGNYLKLIGTFLRKNVKNVRKEVKRDGIELLSDMVVGGRFIKKDVRDWDIIVVVKGEYADKR